MAAILIVQDDFLDAERLRTVLEDAEHTIVDVCARTASALSAARHRRPDLAVVDMMLEVDVDGIATATALHNETGCKILITTGFPDSVIQAEGVDEIACAIVRKPYSDRELLDGVARCLS